MSFLNDVIGTVLKTVQLVGSKANFSTIIMTVASELPKLIVQAIDFGKLNTEQMLDDALQTADLRLGSDFGAIDVLHDLPPDKEEELTDAVLKVCEVLGKNRLKVEGYYQPGTEV